MSLSVPADQPLTSRRLQKRCEVVEVRETAGDDPAATEKESQRILEAIAARSHLVLLDVKGREWTSPELAGAAA